MLTVSMKTFWVYILASRPRGTLYKMLAYYEQHATAIAAIQREKNIKHWSRAWKLDLIRKLNPDRCDLWEDIVR
jgi:putative endonuclease